MSPTVKDVHTAFTRRLFVRVDVTEESTFLATEMKCVLRPSTIKPLTFRRESR